MVKYIAKETTATTLRPNSTITRIETKDNRGYRPYVPLFKTKFHYNKDWNEEKLADRNREFFFKTKFHYNKDWNISSQVIT